MELKIEILLGSFTNLILTLKYSVLPYNTDWSDNVKWNILQLLFLFFDLSYAFFKENLVRHKIKKCGLNMGKILTIPKCQNNCVIEHKQ